MSPFLVNPCLEPLQHLTKHGGLLQAPLAIALSGGADSTALLLAAHAVFGKQVIALHVDHGFQAELDPLFVKHCQALCADLGLRLLCKQLHLAVKKRTSIEEQARHARYHALASMAQHCGANAVLLAHQQDDQAESVLLALSRGAGIAGLAGMARDFERHGIRFWRPLLQVRAQDIRAYLQLIQHPVSHDPINTDMRRTRGRLRYEVLPVLQTQFPAIVQTLNRTAKHAAAAQRILDQVGKDDCATCILTPSNPSEADTFPKLNIAALQALDDDRLGNALRHWLKSGHKQNTQTYAPSSVQLWALQQQIRACRTRGHGIDLKVGAGFVRRQGQALVWHPQ